MGESVSVKFLRLRVPPARMYVDGSERPETKVLWLFPLQKSAGHVKGYEVVGMKVCEIVNTGE